MSITEDELVDSYGIGSAKEIIRNNLCGKTKLGSFLKPLSKEI